MDVVVCQTEQVPSKVTIAKILTRFKFGSLVKFTKYSSSSIYVKCKC